MQFEVGFKRINSDESVMKMVKLRVKVKVVAVYIVKVGDDVNLEKELTKKVLKLTFKRTPKSNVDNKKRFEACGPQNSLDSLNDHKPLPLFTFIPNPRLYSEPIKLLSHEENLLLIITHLKEGSVKYLRVKAVKHLRMRSA